ncbi:MAG: PA2778 family cysteine peptidase [Pseudomonadota bacterium]
MPALFALLAGCASIPEQASRLPAGAGGVELVETPFYPQERYQCGPAALATLLDMSGVSVSLPAVTEQVYIPQLRGSLQAELIAATRNAGRVPYVIDPELSALAEELRAGRAVLVLQNLGVAALPRWHYAVVIGIDPAGNEVVLRSGVDRRRVTPKKTFLRTWARSGFWAMTVIRPDELPARADRLRYFESVAALEQVGQLDAAEAGWRTALSEWPDDRVVLFGLGNVQFAKGDWAGAERHYRALLALAPGLAAVRNNLALSLAYQSRFAESLEEIARGLRDTSDPRLRDELRASMDDVLALREEHPNQLPAAESP